MVITAMRTAVNTLRTEGFPVRHAYPGETTYEIDRVVAAVEVAEVDQEKNTSTIRINVLAPASMGAEECECDALDMCYVLGVAGAVCKMHGCQFLKEANLFLVTISAVFQGTT